MVKPKSPPLHPSQSLCPHAAAAGSAAPTPPAPPPPMVLQPPTPPTRSPSSVEVLRAPVVIVMLSRTPALPQARRRPSRSLPPSSRESPPPPPPLPHIAAVNFSPCCRPPPRHARVRCHLSRAGRAPTRCRDVGGGGGTQRRVPTACGGTRRRGLWVTGACWGLDDSGSGEAARRRRSIRLLTHATRAESACAACCPGGRNKGKKR